MKRVIKAESKSGQRPISCKPIISSNTDVMKPNGGDGVNWAMFYSGPQYPTPDQVKSWGREHGMNNFYWATDESAGYKGMYNGDTNVVFNDPDKMPETYKQDALTYCKDIQVTV